MKPKASSKKDFKEFKDFKDLAFKSKIAFTPPQYVYYLFINEQYHSNTVGYNDHYQYG
jgi:hypothetical protein